MRILFCGSRGWSDLGSIEAWLLKLAPVHDVVIHGGAKGADYMTGQLALGMGFEVLVFEAEWERYGRAAGPRRNERMLREGKPDLVVAFHPDLRKSKGTLDMVRRARKAGLKVILVTGGGKVAGGGKESRSASRTTLTNGR